MKSERSHIDRAKWHEPLVSIIITHHNRSQFMEDALLGIIDQTHKNWECVIVDDASSAEHVEALRDVVKKISDDKIKLVENEANVGQLLSFFNGLEKTTGEFVCLLDPDDRYVRRFLEKSVSSHVTSSVMAPVVCSSQYFLGENGITGIYSRAYDVNQLNVHSCAYSEGENVEWTAKLNFIPREKRGFFFTSTSSLMCRRGALQYLVPHRPLGFRNHADTYLGQGLHLLGGTLYLDEPLVYRMIHKDSMSLVPSPYSTFQSLLKPGSKWYPNCRNDAIDVMLHHKAPGVLSVVEKEKAELSKKD